MLNNLLAITWSWGLYSAVSIICIVIAALCAVFTIIAVMMQSSNSQGISALGSQSETFYSKNKGKNFESKIRKYTVWLIAVMAVAMIVFCFVQFNVDVAV